MNRIYFRRAAGPKIPGAAPRAPHTGALTTQPNAYEQRGVDFLDRALLPPRRRR
jgi:hypothetical protein